MQINKDWVNTAIEGAKLASIKIMEIYQTDFEVELKPDQSPVTIADKASSKILYQLLSKTGIPIISEEETIPNYLERKQHELVWLVDPIDGTKEFIKKNDEFCICIALIQNGKSIFGLIASPTEQNITMGGNNYGVYHFSFSDNNPTADANKVETLTKNFKKTIAYSRSHLSDKAEKFVANIRNKYGNPQIIRKGSALKFVDLTLGKADFYPRLAPTMEWDTAAGQAIFEGVGGEVLDFANFEPLTYNKESLYNPHFIAKNKELDI
ncbi:3'(2'),5'-bisphosphate nucleotidase CysQ family protein [Crocinitomix algicola]|uniref:3'(2'),5'-bisphosphate nucleotidase CysQ family protein n=1 Tax=Crocinitomix algicola TaxID=1740263 RepID=UPI000873041D|nr:inositol monophosphatase family protein [Crocinitomix algicola]